MGNEMGNSNVSGLQEQEKTQYGAPNVSVETPNAANNGDDVREEKEPVLSLKEEGLHEDHKMFKSEEQPRENNLHRKNEALEKSDPNRTKVQARDDFLPVPLVSNDTNDEETKAIPASADGYFHETASTFEPSETSDQQIEAQIPIQGEPETAEVQVPNGSSNNLLGSNNRNDENNQSIQLSRGGIFHDTTPESEKYEPETRDHQIQEQILIGIQGTTDLQSPKLDLKVTLVSNDMYDKETHSVSSSEGESFYETTSESEKNPSEVVDNQVKKLITSGREGELVNSSSGIILTTPNPSSFESIEQTSDREKYEIVSDEPYMGDGSETQNSNFDILGSNRPWDSEEQNSFDHKTEHMLEGSLITTSNSEVQINDHDLQEKESEAQEENLLDMRDIGERKFEIEAEVEVGMTIPAHFNDVENDSRDTQLEAVSLTRTIEFFQVEACESKDTCVVLEDDQIPVSKGSVEEPETDKMEASQVEVVEILSSHEDKSKGNEVDRLYNSGVETDSQTGETGIADRANQVDFHESNTNLIFEKNDMNLENQTEMVGEVSTSSTEFTATVTGSEELNLEICDSAVEVIEKKASDPETEKEGEDKREAKKPTPMRTDHIEPAESSATTYHASLHQTQFQNAKQNTTSLESNVAENMRSLKLDSNQQNFHKPDVIKIPDQFEPFGISTHESQQQELVCILPDSNLVHDPTVFGPPDSNESYKTATEQEIFIPMVDARTDLSCPLSSLIAETVVPVTQNEESVERFTIGSNSSIKAKVTELTSKARTEETDQVPLLYNDVFMLKSNGSETKESKGDVRVGNKGSDGFGEEPSEDQTSTDKQVITLQRTESQKLKTPLLSFLKEESHFAGSQHKQERLAAKKAVEEKWNSDANKSMGISSQGREKRKHKASIFSSCICCTAVIQ